MPLEQAVTLSPGRSDALGQIPGLSRIFPTSFSLEVFRTTCRNRYFEVEAARVYDSGVMKMPVYFSIGQEHISAAIAGVSREFMVFAQHRGHSYYLSFGGNPRALADELLHRETGCARGMGGSASIHDPAIPMYGHSGLMGDQVPIAVGAALGSGRRTLAVVGDASAEEDFVYGAMAYAATKKLPVLFICEDNNLSILTPVAVRRNWSVVDVARSVGIQAADITDDPWLIAHHVQNFSAALPAFLNIRTCRHRWHAGTGMDGSPEWNRFHLIQEELRALGLESQAQTIEKESQEWAAGVWR